MLSDKYLSKIFTTYLTCWWLKALQTFLFSGAALLRTNFSEQLRIMILRILNEWLAKHLMVCHPDIPTCTKRNTLRIRAGECCASYFAWKQFVPPDCFMLRRSTEWPPVNTMPTELFGAWDECTSVPPRICSFSTQCWCSVKKIFTRKMPTVGNFRSLSTVHSALRTVLGSETLRTTSEANG